MPGLVAPSERERVFSVAVRKPLGVVGLVTPWNFPSAIPAWKLAPALVAGNTVVLKPASAAPLSSWRLVEALVESGIPAGVVNYVAGPGSTLGTALVDAPEVKALSFTGSCSVGALLYDRAMRRRLRVQLEMGGKNLTVVLADANLDVAVENTVNGAFASTGQKCTATSRVIVEDAVYEPFVARLVERTRALRVGHGMDPATDVGPAVDAAQLETMLRYIETGRQEGATIVTGGRRLSDGRMSMATSSSPRCSSMFSRRWPSRRKRSSGRCWRSSVRGTSMTPWGSRTVWPSGCRHRCRHRTYRGCSSSSSGSRPGW